MQTVNLITYVVWFATQNDISLTTNRLVKFIYLADLYAARVDRGETLTGFPWRFINYGPYCSEALSCIDNALEIGAIAAKSIESRYGDDKTYKIFSCRRPESENLEKLFHVQVLGKLQESIKKYGDDTPQLLDYVYFETEPMQSVKKGDLLNFSKAQEPTPVVKVKLNKLSPEAIRAARKKIEALKEECRAGYDNLIQDDQVAEKYKDEKYYSFLKLLDGEELPVGLSGTALIEVVR